MGKKHGVGNIYVVRWGGGGKGVLEEKKKVISVGKKGDAWRGCGGKRLSSEKKSKSVG